MIFAFKLEQNHSYFVTKNVEVLFRRKGGHLYEGCCYLPASEEASILYSMK